MGKKRYYVTFSFRVEAEIAIPACDMVETVEKAEEILSDLESRIEDVKAEMMVKNSSFRVDDWEEPDEFEE